MKYTAQEAATEALRRGAERRDLRDRRIRRVLTGSTGLLSVALILLICLMPGQSVSSVPTSNYGSVLLSQEAGGYVLLAVIAFLLGVTATMLCIRKKSRGAFLSRSLTADAKARTAAPAGERDGGPDAGDGAGSSGTYGINSSPDAEKETDRKSDGTAKAGTGRTDTG